MSDLDSSLSAPESLHFLIYSRSYCHLCEDLREALLAALGQSSARIDMVDVDADAELVARYDELVPVLMGRDRRGQWLQLCHYHLDEVKLREFLAFR